MKILAIIPARAGSKGIPNKNIRFISGHPLIYYAINNAIQSVYITDIIVTTDSPEVKIIAKQMGVTCHWREKRLCGDEIALDEVIYDAMPKEETWDYVITMQPTSPTLSVETLNHAFAYMINENADTLISVCNRPHLSWGIKDGKKVPNYTKRLNRQSLPPYYIETGAFLITKGEVITEYNRIGKNVEVYEIPEKESHDIDSFEDLKSAADILTNPKVAIYVNGNRKRGIGHIYRALELADEFFCKPDVYYDKNQTDQAVFGKSTHRLIGVNGITELFEYCKKEQYTLFINDILTTSIDYMIGIKTVLPKAKIVNFEDDGEGILEADLVINAMYLRSECTHVHVGEQYYIAGKSFMFYKPITIREKVKRVFISFGGADPMNYTERLLKMICKKEYKDTEFYVVAGRIKHNVTELLSYNKYKNIHVWHDVQNMPELMTSCDVGITSRGRTAYELGMLGIPLISLSQNEREEKHGFICRENGFTYLGLNPPDEIIEANMKMYLELSKESRQHFQDEMLKHNLRGGRDNVMHLIHDL